jgi:uncharacterized membrane protein (GlpM family)
MLSSAAEVRNVKRLILGFVLVAMVSVASAQGRWFGEALSGELSLVPSFGLSAEVTVGAERLLGPLDLRGGFALSAGGGSALFALGADVLYPIPLESLKLDLGGGVRLRTGGTTVFGLRGIAGLEFPVQGAFALRVEAQPTLFFAGGGSEFDLSIVVGPRVYFR